MKNLLLLLLFFIFTSSKCVKNKQNPCHRVIVIKNNSDEVVYFSRKLQYGNTDSCVLLNRTKIAEHDSFMDKIGTPKCWEGVLRKKKYEICIVDSGGFYSSTFPAAFKCDSLFKKNDVLKSYNLTLDELKEMNFTIAYP